MKEFVLNYYGEFKCIAEKCKHTCCAGWNVKIDEQSLKAYGSEKSEFAPILKRGINFKKSKFKLNKLKRCAFLNDGNLCEIILKLGESKLCQVCRDHPRFRSFFSDRTETGLGFCCEEAARIILSFNEKIRPVLISDDNVKDQIDFNEKNVLEFRRKALNILQDGDSEIDDRISRLLKACNANITEGDFKKVVKTFLSFERIDKNWTRALKDISPVFVETTGKNLARYCEQFLVNSLYRHLSDAEDTLWVRARTIACVLAWWIIKSVIAQSNLKNQDLLSVVVEAVRAYSTEVEYSMKNLKKLYELSYRFIKI